MATTYTINFTNSHDTQGGSGNYCFFNQKPEVNGNTSDPNVFTNVWISKRVPADDTIQIVTTATYYAWTGTAPSGGAVKGATISTGKGLPARLGTDRAKGDTFMMTNDGGTPDIGLYPPATANPSAYQINTGTDFMTSDLYLIGLGQHDDKGKLVPSAVINADQNMSTNIMPIVKFYVSKNSSKQGTVVDFASESLVAGVIDFTDPANQGKQYANVTHRTNGTFTVTYADQVTFNAQQEARVASRTDSQGFSQLQSKIMELEVLFSAFLAKSNANSGEPEVNPIVLYTATIGWLRSMTPAAINTGMTMIYNYLRSRGYTGSWTFNGTNFTTTITITVVPNPPSSSEMVGGGVVPPYIQKDWTNALAADTADKGHTDKGIVPGPPKMSMVEKKHQAAQYLQDNGISANGY